LVTVRLGRAKAKRRSSAESILNAGLSSDSSLGAAEYSCCDRTSTRYIKTTIQVAESKRYAIEVLASGDASEGICPLAEVRVDGNKVGEIQLTTEGWRAYPLGIELGKGGHEFSLQFVNDHSSPSGDRNLRLDKVVFYND